MTLTAAIICSMANANDTQTETSGEISLKDAVSGTYRARKVEGIMPMSDGDHYSVIRDNMLIRHSFATAEVVDTILDLDRVEGEHPEHLTDYIMSPDSRHILVETDRKAIYRRSATADYFVYDVHSNRMQRLSEGGAQECPKFSPDGRLVGFVRNNDLFVVELATMTETRITTDGLFNHIINGKPDWVYEEEFEFFRAFDFSADSRMIAWIRFDETDVRTFSFPLYKGLNPNKDEYAVYTGSYNYKYPKAGEVNSKVSVWTFDLTTRETRTMNVPLDADGYIPRIQFTSDRNRLAIVTLNRLQNRCSIYMAEPHTGDSRLIMSETNDRYVETSFLNNLDFSRSEFVVLSERDGWQHLYLYNAEGRLIRQLTKGEFMVQDFYGESSDGKYFYYSSNEGSPLEKYIYRVDRKGHRKRLTSRKGVNEATFGTDCRYFLNVWSSVSEPPVYVLCNAEGKELKVLEDNAALKERYSRLALGKVSLFSFTTGEGIDLNGWMVKPADFDENKTYPVLMYQYSGPGSQQVLNAWSDGQFDGLIWEHRLAQKGYIVVCVDGRGTGGRGAEWQRCTYGHLGYLEARDQVETALYLGSLPYVDKERIAIWGWSYGGWNTLMSMSEGRPVFRCGVAVAPVTSYRYYDSAYTERYMGLPQTNAEGYDDNPLTRADKLHGELLLIHGFADDNVHFQNMAELTEVYVQHGIQFESQFYTNRNHSIYGGNTRMHLFTRIENFLDKHLSK